MPVHKAPFISFEGGEGAGKTTQAQLLKRRLESYDLPAVLVREPGSTQLGEQIREIIKSNSNNVPAADALLFMAARAQLVYEVIRPHLEKGVTVICDRFSDSTIAYQGYGGNTDLEAVEAINNLATDNTKPNLTFLLDIDPQDGLFRRAQGHFFVGDTKRRFEEMNLNFHRTVRGGYLELASREPNRWVKIDATRRVEIIANEVWSYVSQFFRLN